MFGSKKTKDVIGRAEHVSLPELNVKFVPAKIDTGADLSSIWATAIREKDGVLSFKLFGPKSKFYSGKRIEIESPNYLLTRIASSFGHRELRYVVKLQVEVGGRVIKASFSLSDRSRKTYPVLIGRKLLNGKFLVDVTKGRPLLALENKKRVKLDQDLKVFNRWEKKT